MSCYYLTERLGDNNEMVTFQCNGASDVVWRLNGTVLPVNNNEKYQTNLGYLTVKNIVHSDEGNYTCVSGEQIDLAGCLLVYGEYPAYYHFPPNTIPLLGKAQFSNDHCNIDVSANGTITFHLILSFTQSGPSMKKQTVSKYTLKKDGNSLVTCNPVCDTNPHQWWTLEAAENGLVFVLHQAKSTDRGSYAAEVEVIDPNGDTLGEDLRKTFHVTCKHTKVICLLKL